MDQLLAIEMHKQVVELVSETIVVVRDQRTIAAQVDAQQVRDQRAIVRPVIGLRVIGLRVPATVQPEIDLRVLDLGIHGRVVAAVDQIPVETIAHAIANPTTATAIEMNPYRSLA
jgi:hypothetical protein